MLKLNQRYLIIGIRIVALRCNCASSGKMGRDLFKSYLKNGQLYTVIPMQISKYPIIQTFEHPTSLQTINIFPTQRVLPNETDNK